jgi:exonuclease III
MYIPGRLQEIAEEVLKYKIDIVAVQEIRWQGTGKIDKPNYTFYYGGTKEKKGQYGTGFIVNRKAKDKIIQFEVKNE